MSGVAIGGEAYLEKLGIAVYRDIAERQIAVWTGRGTCVKVDLLQTWVGEGSREKSGWRLITS